MRTKSAKQTKRRGAIAPLTAVMIIPLLGMVAFTVDLGWLVNVQTELQNSADAASLAGCQKLMEPYVQWSMPGLNGGQKSQIRNDAIASAKAAAKQYGLYNSAGGVTLTVLDDDVQVGYTDASGNFNPDPDDAVFPNTVAVTVRRDSNANTPVSLFFAPVLGTNSVPLAASSRAATYAGNVNTLIPLPNTDTHILPVALDVNIWQQFYQTGQSPDGQVHLNANNGMPELQVYPDKWQTDPSQPGSFNLIDTGTPSNSTPAFRSWVTSGVTPNDINYLLINNLVPVTPADPQQWKVGPGLKTTLDSSAFQQVMGQSNLIPVFVPVLPYTGGLLPYQPANGTGQNATFAVIGFVGVTVSYANGSGSNMVISIQPMASVDPTGFIPNPFPGGTSNSNLGNALNPVPQTTFTSPKIVQ